MDHNSKLTAKQKKQLKNHEKLKDSVDEILNLFIEIKSKINSFKKESNKLLKLSEPVTVNKKKLQTGFAVPKLISDELCDFMGVEHGSEVPRTKVTRFIVDYTKDNNLQDPNNKKFIIIDEKLSKIIKIEPDQKLSYFNLQKHINHNYIN